MEGERVGDVGAEALAVVEAKGYLNAGVSGVLVEYVTEFLEEWVSACVGVKGEAYCGDEVCNLGVEGFEAVGAEADVAFAIEHGAVGDDEVFFAEVLAVDFEGLGVKIEGVGGVVRVEVESCPGAFVFFGNFFIDVGDDAAEAEGGAVGGAG